MSSNSHNSMFPTSWIICFDSWLKGFNDWFVVGLVEEHVDSGGSRFSESVLERWHSAILSRVNSSSVLSVVISRCTSGAACSATWCLSGCPHRSWVCSTRISPDRLVWSPITPGVISGCPDRSEEQSKVRTFLLDLSRPGCFAFINKHFVFVIKLPWSITDLGWLEEFCLSRNFSSWLSSNFFSWRSINFWTPFFCPIVT